MQIKIAKSNVILRQFPLFDRLGLELEPIDTTHWIKGLKCNRSNVAVSVPNPNYTIVQLQLLTFPIFVHEFLGHINEFLPKLPIKPYPKLLFILWLKASYNNKH